MTKVIVYGRDLQTTVSSKDTKALVSGADLQASDVVLDPDTKNRYFRSGHERNILATMVDADPVFEYAKKADDDFFQVSENHLTTYNKLPPFIDDNNVFNLSESLSRTVIYSRAFSDAFTLDDNATVDSIVKDYFGNKGNIFGFQDSQAFGVTKGLADAFNTSDAIQAFDFDKGINDSQSLADNFARSVQYQRTFSSTFVLDDSATVDAVRKDTNAGKTNIYTMGDVFDRAVSFVRAFTDSVSPTESHAISFSRTVTPDSFSMSESLSRIVSFARSFSDSVSPTESIDSFSIGKGIADSQPMTDAHASNISLAKTDSTTLTDSPSQSVDLAKTDSFSFSDTDSRVVQFVRTFTDAFALDDAATVTALVKDYGGNKTNIFSFADSQAFGFGKGLTDSFSFSDDPDLEVGKGLTDSVSMSESFDYALFSNAAFNAAQLNLSPFNE